MATLDQPVALHATDEPGRGGQAQVEDLGDAAHRVRAAVAEHEQQPQLAEGQVARRRRRDVPGKPVHDAQEVAGGRGEVVLGAAPERRGASCMRG